MTAVRALIVCFSYHHKNTLKIAAAIANILDAPVKAPSEVDPNNLADYDLVGFGSLIAFGKHHKTLLEFADKVPNVEGKKAFIFSTSGQTGHESKFHKQLREKLQAKGYNIVGEFNCAGFDSFGLTKIVGGIHKGHPNEEDLKAAEAFAQTLMQSSKT
jgi:flavodoxin